MLLMYFLYRCAVSCVELTAVLAGFSPSSLSNININARKKHEQHSILGTIQQYVKDESDQTKPKTKQPATTPDHTTPNRGRPKPKGNCAGMGAYGFLPAPPLDCSAVCVTGGLLDTNCAWDLYKVHWVRFKAARLDSCTCLSLISTH